MQADRKKASKQVGELIKSGMAVEDAKSQVAETLQTIDAELDREVASAKAIQEEIREFLMGIPNVPQDAVPAGNDEDDNVEVRQWGTPKTLPFEPRDHVDVGEALDGGLDFERAAKLQRVQNADLLIADPRCDKRIVNLKTAEIAEIQTALGVVKEYEGGFRHG